MYKDTSSGRLEQPHRPPPAHGAVHSSGGVVVVNMEDISSGPLPLHAMIYRTYNRRLSHLRLHAISTYISHR